CFSRPALTCTYPLSLHDALPICLITGMGAPLTIHQWINKLRTGSSRGQFCHRTHQTAGGWYIPAASAGHGGVPPHGVAGDSNDFKTFLVNGEIVQIAASINQSSSIDGVLVKRTFIVRRLIQLRHGGLAEAGTSGIDGGQYFL